MLHRGTKLAINCGLSKWPSALKQTTLHQQQQAVWLRHQTLPIISRPFMAYSTKTFKPTTITRDIQPPPMPSQPAPTAWSSATSKFPRWGTPFLATLVSVPIFFTMTGAELQQKYGEFSKAGKEGVMNVGAKAGYYINKFVKKSKKIGKRVLFEIKTWFRNIFKWDGHFQVRWTGELVDTGVVGWNKAGLPWTVVAF